MSRLTIPDVLPRLRAYASKHGAGGSLHIYLSDSNCERGSLEFCEKYAREQGDTEGAELAALLVQMTTTQRRKLARLATS